MTHMTLDQAIATLVEFRTLKADWDSYGGRRISADAIAFTEHLIRDSTLPYWLTPMSNGGVATDWVTLAHELTITVGPTCQIDYVLVIRRPGVEDEYIEEENISREKAVSLVRQVVRDGVTA